MTYLKAYMIYGLLGLGYHVTISADMFWDLEIDMHEGIHLYKDGAVIFYWAVTSPDFIQAGLQELEARRRERDGS